MADNLKNRLTSIDTENIQKFTGTLWYVDGDMSASGDGKEPSRAFKTITEAIAAVSDGDSITIREGSYSENGLTLSNDGVELNFEIGATLTSTGTILTISGNYNKIVCTGSGNDGAVLFTPASGQTGIISSGNFNYINNVRVSCGSSANIGFDITGNGCVLNWCRCSNPLVAAFKIQGDSVKLQECCTGGEIADTSIGFWITNECDKARIKCCSSQGHATAGFQIDTGCTNVVIYDCVSGAGDGHYIDDGTLTFLKISDHDSREEHEHTYPTPDGEGTAGSAVTVQSEINDETGADSTANYFGDCAVLVPTNAITTDWFFLGVNLYAKSIADEQRFRAYRINYDVSADKNSGNDWDEGATVLTVTDATEAAQFQTDDLVWITSDYKTDGEIVKVVSVTDAAITIARQTENSSRTGLHWNHTTNDAGTEKMYLCWRDDNRYHSSDFDFSAASARDFTAYRWVHARRMHSSDGLVIRMINGTDDANSEAELTIVWSD